MDVRSGSGALLDDRVALITGGGGAIGSASAELLAAHGAAVAVVDVVEERVDRAVDAIEAAGSRALGVVADLTEPGTIEAAVGRTEDTLGPVDVLVNAIGEHYAMAGPFEASDEAGWDALLTGDDLLPVMRACHAVVAGMKTRGWGRIVNFSSVEGIRAMPEAAPYTAFKAAIDGFTKSLAVEVAGAGVRVNAIAVDKTHAHQTNFYELGDEYDRHVGVWIPAGRYERGPHQPAVADAERLDVGRDFVDGTSTAARRRPAMETRVGAGFDDDPAIHAPPRPRRCRTPDLPVAGERRRPVEDLLGYLVAGGWARRWVR